MAAAAAKATSGEPTLSGNRASASSAVTRPLCNDTTGCSAMPTERFRTTSASASRDSSSVASAASSVPRYSAIRSRKLTSRRVTSGAARWLRHSNVP
jgi:hypothetical protein